MRVAFRFMMVVFVCIFAGNVFAESINTALKFDGTNDYGTVIHNAALSPQVGGQMTLSAWVKFDALPVGDNAIPVSKGSGNTYEYNITVWTDAQVSFCLWRPTGSNCAFAEGGTLTTGQWHNITGTYKQDEYIKVYLDGEIINQSSSFNPPIGSGSSNFYFGKIGGNPENHGWFNGILDDVSIWNYAMTDAQVQQLFNTTLTGSESGLAAYWNFNEGSGQTVTDITGHGNNGILGSGSGIDSADPTWVAGVPEPATMAILALGGMLLRRRMR